MKTLANAVGVSIYIGLIVWATIMWGMPAFFALMAFEVVKDMKKLAANPPFIGVPTLLGVRMKMVFHEGWVFLPGYPFLFGMIAIPMERVNTDFKLTKIRTPDNAMSTVPVAITWHPDDEPFAYTKDGEKHISMPIHNFINYGGHDGIIRVLDDRVPEQVRRWARAEVEGPATWEELQGSGDSATNLLMREIAGEEIESMPSKVPTEILFLYFAFPRPKPTSTQEKTWGANWEKVEELVRKDRESRVYQGLVEDYGRKNNISAITYDDFLRIKVEERLKQVKKAQRGNAKIRIISLGIVLTRLNIGEVDPSGKVAEAADLAAKERVESAGEQKEIEEVTHRIEKLMKSVNDGGLGMTREQAIQFVQTERGKVTKHIDQKEFGISPESRNSVEVVAASLINLLSKGGKKDE